MSEFPVPGNQLPAPQVAKGAELSFREKVSEVKGAFTESWQQASLGGKAILFGAAGTQIYERLRGPEWVAPPIAVNVYMETGSAAKTAITLGGLVAAQQFAIGGTWAETLSRYGKVSEKVGEHFPKTVELAEDIGPQKNRKWYSIFREGFSGFTAYGTTPFLVAQKTYEPEMSRKELHKTSARVTTAIGLAGVVFGKALVEIVEEAPPQYQDDIINVIEKPWPWIGLAAAWELPRFIKKRIARHKAAKGVMHGIE